MTRVKKGASAHKHRKHLLKNAKGFKYGRKSKYKLAKDALRHAWTYAYRDRKVKKRDFRQLWQLQINEAARKLGINYSRFINGLKKKNIEIDRKILSQLIEKYPAIFEKIVEEVKSK
ncbi:MAG: 50S ribosomal protein L20 [Parcubacteria group bacterium GW2011_GWA1_33_6]|uniref:Large ribosomal subunit protein bL20 n=1 Tax=Candidatus Staskawiczbacteria bacterium RIFCSPHIGHO2_02_FULL_33_16 TaxID=1802204 RepID=A0A1G2HUB7_9BACT|nr:MAG: 50S ribosomal protein L20 [Parcubacteria group bacterium GW2011_GWA2_33_14]KKP54889.1 MAG: 50S ribosomal protein L20 [Parcubacteria group bacterium GW2011_GWA1_33_6]OGZ66057.1 MAG: 50S ribosomal protein L20 [Candidatus Staskawiczbacteria bacterium RIFCSPHIGHO2_02_FULL_33_16]OGZ70808.1 MAG: 50S ribosomal protein L20 [Candidatus Staskawiczbacteria bacterium RIFCSPLOWO2_01_FULL_33_13]